MVNEKLEKYLETLSNRQLDVMYSLQTKSNIKGEPNDFMRSLERVMNRRMDAHVK